VEASSTWRNRIIGHGVERPDQLLANPHNFRRHPNVQREALRGSLSEVGVISPVIVNTTTGHLVDGHARVEEYLTAGVPEIDVIYVELTEEEEKLALLALDPVGAMAVNDHRALNALLDAVDADNAGLADLLADLRRQAQSYQPDFDPSFGAGEVTDEDVEAARRRMEGGGEGPDQHRVLCPHCGGSFFVDA
jgi:ParB-like chromosome segregation protein Spo0J